MILFKKKITFYYLYSFPFMYKFHTLIVALNILIIAYCRRNKCRRNNNVDEMFVGET